jgi:hypothetical protein
MTPSSIEELNKIAEKYLPPQEYWNNGWEMEVGGYERDESKSLMVEELSTLIKDKLNRRDLVWEKIMKEQRRKAVEEFAKWLNSNLKITRKYSGGDMNIIINFMERVDEFLSKQEGK